ncbi:MAG: magnesium transporter [Nitrospinae bacterium]|nr:magnesium transporter [Nitrospinota bacterium]
MLQKIKFIKNVTDNIKDRIDSLSPRRLKKRLDLLEAADIADLIGVESSKKNKLRIFNLVANESKGEVLLLLNRKDRKRVLKEISEKRLVKLVNHLESDDAADLLSEMKPELCKKIMIKINPEHAINIAGLMKYAPDSAGGIMQAEFVTVYGELTVEEAIQSVNEFEDIETVHEIFVVDKNERYIGTINVWTLISGTYSDIVEDICNKSSVVVDAFMDQEEVAEIFKKYDAVAVGVVNYENKLIGKIKVDDIVDVIHTEAQEDMMMMAGIREPENILEESVFNSIKSRFPWLFVAVIGGLITGAIMYEFKHIMETVIILATFVPVVMATAGNVATQSSTIMVRRIAVGDLENIKTYSLLLKELVIGLGIGLLSASLVALFAFLWKDALNLGIVVGFSMFGAVITGSIIGVITPLLFKKLKIDPAIASGPMVSSINDFTGIMIYFAIASSYIDLLK